jgi:hypothetical protein
MNTTIEIYNKNLPTWKSWCKTKKLTSCEMMQEIMDHVDHKIQQNFYLSLIRQENFKKPLSGIKLDKNYRKNSSAQ